MNLDKNNTYHFVGIGGIGMSAIAALMYKRGYRVTGSDKKTSNIIDTLKTIGVRISDAQDGSLVQFSDVVVLSSAIKDDNPEVVAAKNLGLRIMQRAEVLAKLMEGYRGVAVSGAHGKTTTTSLIAHLLCLSELDPVVVSGGIINFLGSNFRLGDGQYFVVEADESDGSFNLLPKQISVTTNIDREHLSYYGTFDALKNDFARFITNTPQGGNAVVCVDDVNVREILHRNTMQGLVTYGFSDDADVRLIEYGVDGWNMVFDCSVFGERMDGVTLSLVGRHNVLNACAAIAVAKCLGIGDNCIREALSTFNGVRRRFSRVGTFNGALVIDDYAHHPKEIRAVIEAARATGLRIISVIQPHRYTRLAGLFDEFVEILSLSNFTFVTPVYSAGEEAIDGVNAEELVRTALIRGYDAICVSSLSQLTSALSDMVVPGDVILMMGAGDITDWARDLVTCSDMRNTSFGIIR